MVDQEKNVAYMPVGETRTRPSKCKIIMASVIILGLLLAILSPVWYTSAAKKAPPVRTVQTRASAATEADFFQDLWNSDTSYIWDHVAISLQGRTDFKSVRDSATKPLFSRADRTAILKHPSAKALVALFDNYDRDPRKNEVETAGEITEINAFLDAVLATPIMTKTHEFLKARGLVPDRKAAFKTFLRDTWFGMYPRGGRGSKALGSSGFEHVFLGEVKNGEVSGFHNWIYFLFKEAEGQLDYMGYSKKIDLEEASIVKNKFKWDGVIKNLGSMFVGTSPEYEMAIYTSCFLLHPDADCPVTAAGRKFRVTTHKFKYKGKDLVGSAYPKI